MTLILRIDSSSRPAPTAAIQSQASHSRTLADHVIDQILAAEPTAKVTTRDVVANPIPHILNETIEGYYTPHEEMTERLRNATALSDQLIAEVENADAIVLSIPIYNFSIPSSLKAWIDQVVRIGRTFAYEDGNFRGLIEGKRAYVVLAYGANGYGENETLESFDHLKPYMQLILNFIGITKVEFFTIEATTADESTVFENRSRAVQLINAQIKADWTMDTD